MSKHEFVWCKSIYIWGNFLHDLHLCQGVFRPDFPFRLKDLCCFCRDPFEKRAWIWCWLWILTAQNNRKPTALMPWSQYLLSRSHLRICGGVAGDTPRLCYYRILIFLDFSPWHAERLFPLVTSYGSPYPHLTRHMQKINTPCTLRAWQSVKIAANPSMFHRVWTS